MIRLLRDCGFGCVQGSVWLAPHSLLNDEMPAGGTEFAESLLMILGRPQGTMTDAKLVEAAGIALLPVPARLQHGEGRCEVTLDDGNVHGFDTLYPVLGGDAQSGLAVALGAEVDDNRELVVDAALQTSIDGLYAIGDIASALNQISVAVGHAAIAATAIHNRLPRNYREETASQPEPVADGAGPPP